MKKRSLVVVLGLALSVGFVTDTEEAHASPAGQTYRTIVLSSFGTGFFDCFHFNQDGTFALARFPGSGVWFEDPASGVWVAFVGDGSNYLVFLGTTRGANMEILAATGFNGNSPRDSFFAIGLSDPNCQ